MKQMNSIFVSIYWLATLALLAIGVVMVFAYTPTEVTMGPVQKIFYLHLPIAICTFFSCLTVFVASVGYLWQRKAMWDHLAHAAAQVAVIYAAIVLLTGMIWGRAAWGAWWQWTPRLTFSLVLWLLYVVYLVIRPSIESSQRRAMICAVYGVVAFLDVPLVYLSVRLMPDIHPSSIELEPAMKSTLIFWFIPVIMVTVGLIAASFKLAKRQAACNITRELPLPKSKTARPLRPTITSGNRGVV
ncbi:MAG: cytochrome c biogenesis protein CcsA [Phycisphaeraceae bacterium]|nr:cytochrome c biogenesis protein CcsA [Phycisphaeraceae bacterium]